ncbi:MAG: hypothetical protein ACTHN5_18740 [Phycisphaerae bacterium]
MSEARDQPDTRKEPPLLAYETPSPLAEVGDLFREGSVLVARSGIELPVQCVLCGSPGAGKSIPLKFSWDRSFQVVRHPSTLELRRWGMVRAYLCAKHRRLWMLGRVLGIAGVAASAVLILVGIVLAVISDSSDVPRWTGMGISFMLVGFGLMILFMFFFALRTRTMSCVRIEGGYLYLEGADEVFLKGLREVPEELRG